jgi:branched-chain amino acid transport system substrate-binding protein
VVGHLNSGTTIPASKVYNDCGIPHVTGAATNPNLTKPGYKTTFRIIANDNALGAGLAFYAADTLKLKTVAIVDDRTAYGQGVADVFKKTAAAKGMKVVDEQFTTDKATDFMAILTAIKSKNPDAIFFGGMDPQAGPMLRQMEQLGMGNVKYFGGDGVCTSEIAKLAAAPRHWPTWSAPKAVLRWPRCLAARLGRPSTTPSTPTSSRCTAPTPTTRPSCWWTP